ncbi:ATP-dependent nuclease [Bradyrhizobium erythrophlei]|uniref:Predicted ATP-dependent endonuclease of the OLD family, contains P-loop ATPase and TOPRIM domains n=1 Tax=Bradyrhizobium erythrophlei TaxID=1437360 RepID=A0A1M5MS58_9BRAD|nr:AAA family ATPase [Bradyrhizobium erythrophlei]SHG79623.1 Predicted ATP-dependent endonuclease of the OLD family, contains P-loop ATPase and TOPRIM domains [Bradyrhizobium erythrophlei]
MQIAELRVHGFRGIRDARLRFTSHNVLIGPNNCGKSTIIEALALLFGRDRLVRDLTEHDFFGSDPSAPDRISIVATLTDFAGDDPDLHAAWFREDRAIPKWLDPSSGALHALRTNAQFKLACQIGVAARFDRDDLAVDLLRYFYDDDDAGDVFDGDVVRRVPSQLIRDVGFFLVPANRTWDRTISFGSELFRRVVASIGGQPAAAVLAERDRLRNPINPLEADAGLTQIVGNVEAELKALLGRSVGLKLRLTTTDSDGVLDAVMPHYSIEEFQPIPARRQGSGLISLQHLLLLLHFGRMRAQQNVSFMLAMEEPELHIPPPLQRKLIHRIRSLSTQTIIVTHSPVVAAACDPTALTIVHNNAGSMRASKLLADTLPLDAPNWKRMLFVVRRQDTITALMHETILVPEGRIDFDLLSLMVNSDESRHEPTALPAAQREFGSHIGVVPTQDANVVGVFEELRSIHQHVICLVDGDAAGEGYANTLLALAEPPPLILQWPAGWEIEDTIGWIAEANIAVLPRLAGTLGRTIATVPELVAMLKTATNASGLKGDFVAYELIIASLAEETTCLKRMRLVLQRFALASSEPQAPQGWTILSSSTARTTVLRFTP